MNSAYLLIGGNLGDRREQLAKAAKQIEKTCGRIIRLSHLYETEAWGKTDQPSFYNQALLLHTPLAARDLLKSILGIESSMGRQRLEKYGPRVIDIDILLFNEEIIHVEGLDIPHPELIHRRFALAPLNEIAAQVKHPLLKKTIRTLLKECRDGLNVRKLEN